ncbi:MAG TPA: HNH endonuclease [Herbaspirillum sp.]|jgi:hypothetical protein
MNINDVNGNPIAIRGARRDQHNRAANKILNNGHGGASPPNYTWHHQNPFGYMIQVDAAVHAKHGHNGGIYLW